METNSLENKVTELDKSVDTKNNFAVGFQYGKWYLIFSKYFSKI